MKSKAPINVLTLIGVEIRTAEAMRTILDVRGLLDAVLGLLIGSYCGKI